MSIAYRTVVVEGAMPPDAALMAQRIQDECNSLDQAGYEVISILPMSLALKHETHNWGVDQSLIITARRMR